MVKTIPQGGPLQRGQITALTALAKSFTERKVEVDAKAENRPIIFIIDELDRCKPSFALELLERIKHIFSIENVHFVLSAQLGQLENSVRFNYGSDIDALTYLQKFYNVIVHFPEQSRSRHERLIPKFVAYLCNELSLDKDSMAIVRYVAEMQSLSFRTIERISTCMALARAFVPSNHLWISPIISVLCIMKIIAPEMFRRVREGRVTLEEIKAFVAPGELRENIEEINMEWISGWWGYCLAKDEPSRSDPEFQPFSRYLFSYSIARENIIPAMSRYLDSFQPPSP